MEGKERLKRKGKSVFSPKKKQRVPQFCRFIIALTLFLKVGGYQPNDSRKRNLTQTSSYELKLYYPFVLVPTESFFQLL